MGKYTISRINKGGLTYEVKRLWESTNEYVGCFKAETYQDAARWIRERENKEIENIKAYETIDQNCGS